MTDKREAARLLVEKLKAEKWRYAECLNRDFDLADRHRREFERLLGEGERNGLFDVSDLFGCSTWTKVIVKIEMMYGL